MQSVNRAELLEELRRYLLKDLLRKENLKIDENVALIEEGYLTSLQTVELVMFIEERYKVEIEPELVNEDTFRSLGSITTLVTSKLGAPK